MEPLSCSQTVSTKIKDNAHPWTAAELFWKNHLDVQLKASFMFQEAPSCPTLTSCWELQNVRNAAYTSATTDELFPRQQQSQIKVEPRGLPTSVAVNESNVSFCSGTDFLILCGRLQKKKKEFYPFLIILVNLIPRNAVWTSTNNTNSASLNRWKLKYASSAVRRGMMYSSCQRRVETEIKFCGCHYFN